MFVAVAVRVEAVEGPDHTPPRMMQAGFQWRGGEESFFASNGEIPPWNGPVNQPTVTRDFAPGDPEIVYVTFDVPARGGTLVYISPGGKRARRAIPKAQGGKGLAQFLRFIKTNGLTQSPDRR